MDQKKKLINLNVVETDEEKEHSKKNKIKKDVKVDKASDISKSFRMISKIEPQRAKGRYNVYINDVFAFGVDEEVLIKFELKKGLHIPNDLQTKIESEESYYKAYNKTLNYLSYSLRSEKQIKDYLVKNDLAHYSERLIQQLKDLKLIDDLVYAQSYVRTQANVNLKGPRNIERELKEKGVPEQDIWTALDEYSYEQQLQNAVELSEKQWKKTSKHSTIESINKVKKYLLKKGYSFELIDEIITNMDTKKDEDVEYDALLKQADKANRRYSRKYEGYELLQKLKAFLYSKGYPTDLINRYFNEKEID